MWRDSWGNSREDLVDTVLMPSSTHRNPILRINGHFIVTPAGTAVRGAGGARGTGQDLLLLMLRIDANPCVVEYHRAPATGEGCMVAVSSLVDRVFRGVAGHKSFRYYTRYSK